MMYEMSPLFLNLSLQEEDDKVSKRFIQKFQAGLRLVDQTAVFGNVPILPFLCLQAIINNQE